MNQSLLLHLVERLEGLVGRLPSAIQKPILSELTPLKEIFLRQRAPRLIFTGSPKIPLAEILPLLFPEAMPDLTRGASIENRWQEFQVADRGSLSVLDARTGGDAPGGELRAELKREPADMALFIDESGANKARRKIQADNLIVALGANPKSAPDPKIIVLTAEPAKSNSKRDQNGEPDGSPSPLEDALEARGISSDRIVGRFHFEAPGKIESERRGLLATMARELPNEARMEMARISHDKQAQAEIAQLLVKSTTAVCTAVGAQPIPLADLPILTGLQLLMVSGIMYVSGRERSLRAATEFIGALGANVGVGMLLREGTRAILKFFPGWGNVVCGMVAGAGTYGIGRAATLFFLEGVSLKDARRTYLSSRRRSKQPRLPEEKTSPKRRLPAK